MLNNIENFNLIGRLQAAARRGDILFALGLIVILTVLILPMPKILLDFSLAISLSFSVIVLMTALFIQKSTEFNSFPSILLVATMLRLALNVASTRLILAHGHEGEGAAGEVIKAFGSFVMGGNFVIGIIVFIILVIVNFVVITKGATRIAEVSARFALDAMPGKQMAIDSDLAAGIINEDEAKARRKALELETNFYGAMDGASKFVRGDAVAGILITMINIIAGIIIGTVQKGLDFSQALHSYTILTVGDGLVTQIPALIVSTSAGMLVAKSGGEGSTDKELFGQLSAYPVAVGMTSFLMLSLALLPGIPMLPFLFISVGIGFLAYKLYEKQAIEAEKESRESAMAASYKKEKTEEEEIQEILSVDQIGLEVGYNLLPIVNENGTGSFIEQIKGLRKQLAGDLGVIIPSIRIMDNLSLEKDEYAIKIKGIVVARSNIRPNMLLCMNPSGDEILIDGEDTFEPVFNLRAKWIANSAKDEAESLGYTVVEPKTVIVTHITELIKENIGDMLNVSDIDEMFNALSDSYKKILDEMVPSQITKSSILRVFQNLLKEKVSIKDIETIIEALSEVVGSTRNITVITEHVRARLGRQICAANVDEHNILNVLPLSDFWEEAFNNAIIKEGDNAVLAMAPTQLQNFIAEAHNAFAKQLNMGVNPIVLTSPNIRPFVYSVVERFSPNTVVLSQNEIHPKVKLNTIGYIGSNK